MTWASELDRRAMDKVEAVEPRRVVPQAVALLGLLYALAVSGFLLFGTFTFSYVDAATRARSLLLLPWSAAALLLVLRGSPPRPVAVLVLAGALAQYALTDLWGLELVYLPIALVGLTLLPFSRHGV